MSNLGNFMRSKREEAGLTIKNISEMTAIRVHIIEILEEGRFDTLPSYVYAHGFLEQYSKALGLDFREEVKPLFEQECSKETFGQGSQNIETVKDHQPNLNKKPFNFKLLIGIVILAAVAALVVAGVRVLYSVEDTSEAQMIPRPSDSVPEGTLPYVIDEQNLSNPTIPNVNTNSEASVIPGVNINDNASMPATTATQVTNPDNATASATMNRAAIRFSEQCWINYLADNGNSADYIAEAGQERYIYFDKHFRLNIGNASAVSITYGAETFTNFGSTGQPMRNLYFVLNDSGTMNFTLTAPTQ